MGKLTSLNLLKRFHHVWLQHVLFRSRIPYALWHDCIQQIPALRVLTRQELHRLRKLTSLFLHNKTINGANGLTVDDRMRVIIASQACLLILNLRLDYFDGWSEIIVYPTSFIVAREERLAEGIIHETRRRLGGESWSRGPVILSWADAKPGARSHGLVSNVILHEFAHKIDMLNGAANGMPPLHANMIREHWTKSLSKAYKSLYQQIERHQHTSIDPYASESPAEFFAVLTEIYFEQPVHLHHIYPAVYKQLSLFYRQDPLHRPNL